MLINLADHETRSKANGGNTTKTIGAVYGFQEGLNVHIYDSCELVYDANNARIDMDFLGIKTDQVQQCFPTYELLGWYSTGAQPSEVDIALHKQITEVNDNPLFLLLNAEKTQSASTPQKVSKHLCAMRKICYGKSHRCDSMRH